MRWLITGVAGFIGSHLLDFLLLKGEDVVGLDNLSTGSKNNLPPGYDFVQGDIRDLETCKKVMNGVDIVLHQAALGSVPRSILNPKETHDVNVNGFLNILLAARDASVSKVVYASSSSVYGDSIDLPKVEKKIGKALSPYALSKQTNENYAELFAKTYGIPIIGLRYFNVFGLRQNPNGPYAAVIPKWIESLKTDQSISINGDLCISRDFTYIDNIVGINIQAAGSQKSGHNVYNGATGRSITLQYLSDTLSKALKINTFKTHINPLRQGDILHSLADISLAKQELNYSPQVSFEEGIVKMTTKDN